MPLVKNDREEWVNFIHIPKNAGSSIEDELVKNYDICFEAKDIEQIYINDVSQQHVDRELSKKIGLDKLYSKSFCIVRNPVDRLISEYRYRCKSKLFTSIFDFNSFVYYVFNKSTKCPNLFDNHIRPQVDFIFEDTTIYFLEDGMDEIVRGIGETFELSKINVAHSNSSKKKEIKIYKETLEEIYSFYKEDFELGYEKNVDFFANTPAWFNVKNKISFFFYEIIIVTKMFLKHFLYIPNNDKYSTNI